MQSTFESDPGISSQLSLYRQNGSKVIEGDLITLPVAGGLIYEEPFYIQAAGTAGSSFSGSYPVLKRIAVSFGGNVGFGPTLQSALSQVVPGLGSGTSSGGSAGGGTSTGSVSAAVRNYLAQAESDYAQAQAALKHGDLGSYQKYIAKMKTALDQAQRAAQPRAAQPRPPRRRPLALTWSRPYGRRSLVARWADTAADIGGDAHRQVDGGRTLGRDGTFMNADLPVIWHLGPAGGGKETDCSWHLGCWSTPPLCQRTGARSAVT